MTLMNRIRHGALALATAALAVLGGATADAQPLPQDVITVGTVTSVGGIVDVPVYIRDVTGTPLGMDRAAGLKIQAYSIKVNYTAPVGVVQSVTFSRDGITSSLTPTFESSPSTATSISLIDSFDEATNLIPFTLDATAPGNQVAHLLFHLAPGTPAGTVITLTLDPTVTQLSNEGGTTSETTTGGNLLLVNGSITITPAEAVPTVGEWGLLALAAAIAIAALRFRL